MDIVAVGSGLAALLMTFVLGGGVSRGLDHFAAWSNWHPADPFFKSAAVIAINALLGFVITWTSKALVPQLANVDSSLQAALVWLFLYLGSFINYQAEEGRKG